MSKRRLDEQCSNSCSVQFFQCTFSGSFSLAISHGDEEDEVEMHASGSGGGAQGPNLDETPKGLGPFGTQSRFGPTHSTKICFLERPGDPPSAFKSIKAFMQDGSGGQGEGEGEGGQGESELEPEPEPEPDPEPEDQFEPQASSSSEAAPR
uniref:LO1b n=1 Tax=Carp adomavirus TaxID=2609874 RepID=A0A6F9FA99_9VIRU|nr:TPA_asm: LO1b [Carp adomavirus]